MPGTTAADMLQRAKIEPSRLERIMPRVRPMQVPVRVAPAWMLTFWARGIKAMTLPWGIYVHPDIYLRVESGVEPRRNGTLMVHELMHVEQVRRHGAIRHSVRYLADYVRGRASGLDHWDAYRAIPAEAEARAAARLVMEHR